MKNLMNNVDNVLTESLDGFAAAHADIVALGAEHEFVRRKRNKPGKVALISGGGAGHEPLHAGFVGHGMLDAACPGQIFTSPTPNQMMNAAQAVDGGAGVLFIVKNYSGDMMNFQMASEMLDQENAVVVVNDDVAVEDSTYTTGRRGVAGTLKVTPLEVPGRVGAVLVTSPEGALLGIFTGRDALRCLAQAHLPKTLAEVMTRNPITIRDDALAVDALRIFNDRNIDDLIVVNANKEPVGLVDSQDLPKLKLM
jgi:CBS domain-containing protein